MATKNTLFMETTEVPAERSASEICASLVQAGASRIATDYTEGKITGLRWTMRLNGQDLLFAMPARVGAVYKQLEGRQRGNNSRWYGSDQQVSDLRAKSERIAWRQLLRWVQAQLAMIATGMVESAEVFFPYMVFNAEQQTAFEVFKDQKLLAAPEQ